MNKTQLIMIAAIGGIAAAVGCFLPWISINVGPISASQNALHGMWTAGWLVLILAGAGGFFAFLSWQGKTKLVPLPAAKQLLIGGACLAGAAVFTLINFMKDFGANVGGMGASRGFGLWLSLAGSIAGAVCMFLVLKQGNLLPKVAASDSSADGGGDDSASGDA